MNTNSAIIDYDSKFDFPAAKRHKFQSSLFLNIKFCCIGKVKGEVLNTLKDCGGEYTPFKEFATHCILGDGYTVIEADDIKDLYDDVQIVLQKWVLYSVYCNKQLPTKYFSHINSNLLKNYSICLSKLDKNDCKLMWILITSNGASCSLHLTSNTTHLITTSTKSRKYEYASRTNRIKIVSPLWLMDSVRNKMLANEVLYHPRLLIEHITEIEDVNNNKVSI